MRFKRNVTQVIIFLGLFYHSLSYTYAQAQQDFWLNLNTPGKSAYPLKKRLVRLLESNEYDSLKLSLLLSDFKKNGFIEASIDSFNSGQNKYLIHLGNRYYWKNISISLNDNEINEINALIPERRYKNKPANIEQINTWENKIVSYLETQGYPFAQATCDSLILKDQNAYATLSYKTNKLFRTDSFENKGNIPISSKFLHNYLGIKHGEAFNENKIAKIDKNLSHLSFYTAARESYMIFDSSQYKIYTFLNKKSANYFNALIGIVPIDEDDDKTTLTGELFFSAQNLLKQKEKISIEWRRLQALTQSLNTTLSVPYLLNTKAGTDLYFSLFKQDSSYINLTFKASVGYYFSGLNNIKLSYYNENSSLLATPVNNSLSAYHKTGYGLSFEATEKDNILLPRKGYFLNSEILLTKKTANSSNDQNEENTQNGWQGNINLAYFIPVTKSLTLKLKNTSSWLAYDSIFYNENLRIGGAKILRGFDEEAIRTPVYNVSTLETHFFVEQNASVFIFNDFGIYKNINFSKEKISWANGFGFGFNILSNMGLFTIQYALGKTSEIPLKLRNSKVHIGYINNF